MAVAAAGLVIAGFAHAAPFTNGSFESGPAPGTWHDLPFGSTDITGWTVTVSNIEYIGTAWTPADGSRSVDLNGTQPGAISQTFDTVAGTTYGARFMMAGNPGGVSVKTLRVSAASSSADFTFDITGHTTVSMGWEEKVFAFLATGASTTLAFSSLTLSPPPMGRRWTMSGSRRSAPFVSRPRSCSSAR